MKVKRQARSKILPKELPDFAKSIYEKVIRPIHSSIYLADRHPKGYVWVYLLGEKIFHFYCSKPTRLQIHLYKVYFKNHNIKFAPRSLSRKFTIRETTIDYPILIKENSDLEFLSKKLKEIYRKPIDANIRKLIRKKYGSKGEGSEHRKLKKWVLDHPEKIGLQNVMHKEEERRFLSQDLADVYFELADGRYVVVEIETTDALPGAFQALKYKVLKCAELGINIKSDRVIAILIAWQVPKDVKGFCAKYGIRWIERKI